MILNAAQSVLLIWYDMIWHFCCIEKLWIVS
jgi:hypothetical protein